VTAVATALATGIAGLINVHDPDVVTLGGLAGPLRAAAGAEFQTAYIDGLMAFRRDRPPSILDAAHGDNGSLHGAAAVGLDRITSEDSLSDLAMRSNRTP
jgi:predicted NBD/HSP70 family sugar kinase